MAATDALPRTVEFVYDENNRASFVYVDERMLPDDLVFAQAHSWEDVVAAIKTLAVRGAPALGAAGAAALALWADEACVSYAYGGACQASSFATAPACEAGVQLSTSAFLEQAKHVAKTVCAARPTAVNLAWGVSRVMDVLRTSVPKTRDLRAVAAAAFRCVKDIEAEDEVTNRQIGEVGAPLLPMGARVLTHCNAGSLATVFYGTALGVIYTAHAQGKIVRVYADETRPVAQGARLTAWELSRAGVPVTLICDNMAASLMASGEVDAVVVGADRIAANGDVANKIGTYGLAVLASYHHIPFYVAAPSSTFDHTIQSGADIPIEERSPEEVAPAQEGVDIWNPAFDVTPAQLVTKIITEQGAFAPHDAAKQLVVGL